MGEVFHVVMSIVGGQLSVDEQVVKSAMNLLILKILMKWLMDNKKDKYVFF